LDAAVFCGLIALAVATRLVMIEPNFHAVTAASLFAGFYFRRHLVAAMVPLLAMTLSDWVIGGYSREVMVTVYLAMLLPIAWRGRLRVRLNAPRVALAAVASSVIFYLTTNAAVWHSGIWYSHGWDGLGACYAAGVPFLVNALAGDLLFSAGLFGAYALATRSFGASSQVVPRSAALDAA
jgi:hypothetical protein